MGEDIEDEGGGGGDMKRSSSSSWNRIRRVGEGTWSVVAGEEAAEAVAFINMAARFRRCCISWRIVDCVEDGGVVEIAGLEDAGVTVLAVES